MIWVGRCANADDTDCWDEDVELRLILLVLVVLEVDWPVS